MQPTPLTPRPTRLAAVLLVLAALIAGCRVDLVADVTVDADGSGVVALVLHLDAALLDELDALRVDPTAELAAAVAALPEWTLERTGGDADDLVVTVSREVRDPSGFGDALRDLVSGLAPDDPAIDIDIEVEVADDGATTLTGTVGFRSPRTAGATLDDEPLGPAGDDLAAMVAATVSPRMVVRLPGAVENHDADEVDGGTLVWAVPVDDERTVTAQAAPPSALAALALWGAAAAGVVAVTVAVLATFRRRRGSSRPATRAG